MTGGKWSEYFCKIQPEPRKRLFKALLVLDADPAFRQEYGSQFRELIYIMAHPFLPDRSTNDHVLLQKILDKKVQQEWAKKQWAAEHKRPDSTLDAKLAEARKLTDDMFAEIAKESQPVPLTDYTPTELKELEEREC